MKLRYFFQLSALFLLAGLFCGIPAGAQEDEESEGRSFFTAFTDTFDGYLENATAVRLDEVDRFTKIKNSLRLKYEHNFGEHVILKLDSLSVYDAVYDVEDLDVEDEDEYRAYVDLREATLNLFFGKFDLRLGKQQVIWEITDGMRVLDAVNPMNLKEFVLDDFENLRIPLWIVNFEYYLTLDYSLQALIIPEMTFTDLPNAGSEFEIQPPSAPQGLQLLVSDTEEPDASFENTRYGLRLKGLLGNWDFTLNYLYTWADLPVQKKTPNPAAGTLTVSPEYERMQVIGGSLVNVLFDTVVRFELAGKLGRYFNVSDPNMPDMVVEKDTIEYALGLERDLFDITWLFQVNQQLILDYDDAISPEEEVNTSTSLRASKFLDDEEKLEFEITGLYRFLDNDYLIRSSLTYDITDVIRLTGGADIFGGGDEDSFFGRFDENDRLYAELRYSF